MKERPDVKSVVHCHPPHATAFAVAREPIPQCVLPEVEVFLGDVPITHTKRPAARSSPTRCCRSSRRANVIILANHGTVSFGETVEQAYWWTEILDAYCRILMLARDLGRVNYFTRAEDARAAGSEDASGASPTRGSSRAWRTATSAPTTSSATVGRQRGVERRAFEPPPPMRADRPPSRQPAAQGDRQRLPTAIDQEALVKTITDRVMAALERQMPRRQRTSGTSHDP